jgi:hypothetical protein
MAISFSYDHPHYEARRSFCSDSAASSAGTGNRLVSPFPITLTGVSYRTVTAGTSGANTYIVTAGTTVVGTLTAGTSAAGATGTLAVTPVNVAALTQAVYAVKGAEATGVATLIYEYKIRPLSDVTA